MLSLFSYEIWFFPHKTSTEQTLIHSPELHVSIIPNPHNENQFKLTQTMNAIPLHSNMLDFEKWVQIVGVYNTNTRETFQYINGRLRNESTFSSASAFQLSSALTLGATDTAPKTKYFSGIIDEFRTYNTALPPSQVLEHYYNYKQKAKSCCSTITLINPNALGYNTAMYPNSDVSYSSRLFFERYNNANPYDITIYDVKDNEQPFIITSDETHTAYYNFHMDICLANAFNIFHYAADSEIIKHGIDGGNCSKLIEAGLY